MFDVNDDAKADYRRVEILTGPGRRRRWSAEEKARIVEETLAPGARVSEVARRWQVCSQQVFGWRRAAYRAVTTVSTNRPQTPAPDFGDHDRCYARGSGATPDAACCGACDRGQNRRCRGARRRR